MGLFLIVKADGSHIVVASEKLNDVTERVYLQTYQSFAEGRLQQKHFDRTVQLNIWNLVEAYEDFYLTAEEASEKLKTECQYVLDHYDDVYGLRFLDDVPLGASTCDLRMEFLNEEQVCNLMKEAA